MIYWGNTGACSRDNQEKEWEILRTLDKETNVDKDTDRRKSGGHQGRGRGIPRRQREGHLKKWSGWSMEGRGSVHEGASNLSH